MRRLFSQYWHTLRYLRPIQVYGRLWFRWHRPAIDASAPPAWRPPATNWLACARAPRQTGPDRFAFIGVERSLTSAGDWDRPDWPKLWLYNLHYFDDLVADGSSQRAAWHRALITRWIDENRPGQGNGWEPYPTSLRIVNWVKWLLHPHAPIAGLAQSLAIQTRFLRGRIERHLLGNHVWANYKALIFSGCAFQGPEADAWRSTGLAGMRDEIAEQVLADGGHFERSPMYQATLLEDLLDLLQLAHVFPDLLSEEDRQLWRATAERMLAWLGAMSHPDGDIAFFNDAAFGIAPTVTALQAYALALGLEDGSRLSAGSIALQPSGYLRMRHGSAVVLVDAAPVGPDHLPGHAHADTLSFEWSLGSSRVLVNGGTSTYANDSQRRLERSTASHNTLQVDGEDSSEVWAAFRVARRARPLDVSLNAGDERCIAQAAHDGYRRLPGAVLHRRRWTLSATTLKVEDELQGQWRSAVARFRAAPPFRIVQDSAASGRLIAGDRSVAWVCEGAEARVEQGAWHPRFGSSQATDVLVLAQNGSRAAIQFSWDPSAVSTE